MIFSILYESGGQGTDEGDARSPTIAVSGYLRAPFNRERLSSSFVGWGKECQVISP